jgi:hypothetical protein
MASEPSMDAHFSPKAQSDMGYHDWNPCELYPQTERPFDAHEDSLDWLPGLTDEGSASPTLSMVDDFLSLPDRSRWHTFSKAVGDEEEVLPPGFWRPNMLYETKAWWAR